MNKQSNTYIIVYASVMVIIVAAVLAFTSLSLKPMQTKNIELDKMKQILSSIHVASDASTAAALYEQTITETFVINENGDKLPANAFDVDIAAESKVAPAERQLPVFVATLKDGSTKYILPVYGAGLWGPIWGYISLDADGNTLFGAYFAHQGETPGLGAEIEKPFFTEQFVGKHLNVGGAFKSIAVEKKGQKPLDGAEYVDAIAGGTITSKGVQAMMKSSLQPYEKFLKNPTK